MTRPQLTRRSWLASCACGLSALGHQLLLPGMTCGAPEEKKDPPVPAGDDIPCAELHLPLDKQKAAAEEAKKENPDNVVPELPMPKDGVAAAPLGAGTDKLSTVAGKLGAVLKAKKWAKGRTLKVHFLGGNAAIHKKVQQYAEQWSQFANIKFQFGVTAPQSDVRIDFADKGHWSYLGTDILSVPKTDATMNLQLTASSSDAEYSRVVIHEFGHTLGLIHEHQHPTGGIPWNKPQAYAYYMQTQGWDKPKIDANIFATYAQSWLQYGVYDKLSIMHYAIPAFILTNPAAAVGWNTVLSTLDKLFIKSVYPA